MIMILISLARTVVDTGALFSLLSHLLKRLQFRRRCSESSSRSSGLGVWVPEPPISQNHRDELDDG
jgi:hypothetical protein